MFYEKNNNMKSFPDLIIGIFIAISSFVKLVLSKRVNFKSQNNQPGFTRPTFLNSNPCKLCYYPIMISLDRYDGSCTTLEYALKVQWEI